MPFVFPIDLPTLKASHSVQSTLSKRIDSQTEGGSDIDFLVSARINFATENNQSHDTDVPDNMSRLMYCFAIPSLVFFWCLVQCANFSICFCSCFEHIGFQWTLAWLVIGQSTILRGKYRMIIHSIRLCISFSLSLTHKTNDVIRLLSGCKRSYSSSYLSPTHLLVTWLRKFACPPSVLLICLPALVAHPFTALWYIIWNHRSEEEQAQLFAFEDDIVGPAIVKWFVWSPLILVEFPLYTLLRSQHD